MPFKLAKLAPLFALAVAMASASAVTAHPRVARCCCRSHAVHRHLTHVRTIVREKVIIDHIVEGPSEWRPAPPASPPQEVQISDLWLSGGVGPAYVGGGGGGGFAYAQSTGSANAGAFASANAMAAAEASVSANIAIHVGVGGHGGHGCGCGKGGH